MRADDSGGSDASPPDASPAADQEPNFPATSDAPATPAPSPRVPTDHAARASNQGFLPDKLSTRISRWWIGRDAKFARAVAGTIPAELAPILDRLKLNGDGWIETVRCYGRWFKQVVGGLTSMKKSCRADRSQLVPWPARSRGRISMLTPGRLAQLASAGPFSFRDGHRNWLTAWSVSEPARDPDQAAASLLRHVAAIDRSADRAASPSMLKSDSP